MCVLHSGCLECLPYAIMAGSLNLIAITALILCNPALFNDKGSAGFSMAGTGDIPHQVGQC